MARVILLLWCLLTLCVSSTGSKSEEDGLVQFLSRLLRTDQSSSNGSAGKYASQRKADITRDDRMESAKVSVDKAPLPAWMDFLVETEDTSRSDKEHGTGSLNDDGHNDLETLNVAGEDVTPAVVAGRPRVGEVMMISRNGVPRRVATQMAGDMHVTDEEGRLQLMQKERLLLQAYNQLRLDHPELPPPNPRDYPHLQVPNVATSADSSQTDNDLWPVATTSAAPSRNPSRRSHLSSQKAQTQRAESRSDKPKTDDVSREGVSEERGDIRRSLLDALERLVPVSSQRKTARRKISSRSLTDLSDLSVSPIRSNLPDPASATDQNGEGKLEPRARTKRFVEGEPSKRWTHGIVPYVFSSEIKDEHKPSIRAAMLRVERYTCIRFVPWSRDVRRRYNLDHDGFLRFIRGKGCYSAQGNERNNRGQAISCCGGVTCVHELGHALGLAHEQNSPDRDNYTRVNWQNIKKDFQQWYRREKKENFIMYKYNPSSIMGYGPTVFNIDGRPSMDTLEPNLLFGRNFYYYYGEIAKSHRCHSERCGKFTLTCQNDGYVSVENNFCTCRCPPGLDPSTGCTTIEKVHATQAKTWPRGTYALLATDSGCPGNNEFELSSRMHVMGEKSHMGKQSHLGGKLQGSEFTLNFCVKRFDVPPSGVEGKWTPGKYCIHRFGGTCPKGFQEGFVQFDDVRPGQSRGPMPDGVFGANSLYRFCCRDDGFDDDPLLLPNTRPFILYRQSVWQGCQKATGMEVVESYFIFDNSDLEGVAAFGGSIPRKYAGPGRTFYIFYCYYIPRMTDCGEIIELSPKRPEASFTSPGHPGTYPNSLQCAWFIKGPKDSNLVLEFLDLELEAGVYGCPDYVEVKAANPGGVGVKYCGDGLNNTILSVFNTMMVTLVTDNNTPKRGFRAHIRLVQPSKLCYLVSDQGRSYRGKVNVTESGRSCLSWTDVTHCRHHAFQPRDDDYGLERNYCRNPGHGTRPWCYTQQNGCKREYCDVCGIGRPGNRLEECANLAAKGHCSTRWGQDECPESCRQKTPPPPPAAQVRCSQSPSLPDGEVLGALRSAYRVGEKVTLQCSTGYDVLVRTCLTNGHWSNGGYVCGGCSSGWTALRGLCYRYFPEARTAISARDKCRQHGAILSPAASEQERQLLISLKEPMTGLLLGLSDELYEGRWLWSDGKPASNLHWRSGQPDNFFNEDCAVMSPEYADNLLSDKRCDSPQARFPFVCRELTDTRMACADRRSDCQSLLEAVPDMCRKFPDFVFSHCPASCFLCRASKGAVRTRSVENTGMDETRNCSVPPAPMHAVKMTQLETLPPGGIAHYQCDVDYVVTSGNLERACLMTGQLTGAAALCQDMGHVTTPLNSLELVDRVFEAEAHYTLLGGPSFVVTRPGQITRWRFYTRQSRDLALQVWRPRDDLPANTLVLVGQTRLVPSRDRVFEAVLEPDQAIVVFPGDRVGLWAGTGRGGVPYDACQSTSDETAPASLRLGRPVTDADLLRLGHAYEFVPTPQCASFSLSADISPV